MQTDLQKKLADLRRQYPAASFQWIWQRIQRTHPELIRGEDSHAEQAREAKPPQSRTNSKQYPANPNTSRGDPIPKKLSPALKAQLQAAIENQPASEISVVMGGFATLI